MIMRRGLPRRSRPWLAAAMAALLAAPAAAGRREREAEQAGSIYMESFDAMSKADDFARASLMDEAAEFYLEAQVGFEKLISTYPKWNPDLAAYRAAYCARQLRKIESGELEAALLGAPGVGKSAVVFSPDGLLEDLPAETNRPGVPAFLEKASSLERKGLARDALALYEEVILEEPGNRDAVKGAARCCLQLGLVEKGRNMLMTALPAPSEDAEAAFLLAAFHLRLRDHERAIMLMLDVLRRDQSNARAHLLLGVALMESGQLDRAEAELNEALAWDPAMGDAHYDLARLNLRKRPPDTKKAREHYGQAMRLGGARDADLDKVLKMPK